MAAQPVEWVLVVHYGASAHRATYGRLPGTQYTKDYIQLSRKGEFLDAIARLFPVDVAIAESVPLTYQWPTGTAPGALVFKSDRPDVKLVSTVPDITPSHGTGLALASATALRRFKLATLPL